MKEVTGRQILISFLSNFMLLESGFQDGLNIPKFSLIYENNEDYFILTKPPWRTNPMHWGVLIGSVISLCVMDKIGHKKTMILSIIPKIGFWLCMLFQRNPLTWFSLDVGRLYAGIGCGVIYTVSPMHLNEIEYESSTTEMAILMAGFANIGMLIAYNMAIFELPKFLPISMIIALPILYICYYIWAPESLEFLKQTNNRALKEDQSELARTDENEVEKCLDLTPTDDIRVENSSEKTYRKATGVLIIIFTLINLINFLPLFVCEKNFQSNHEYSYSVFFVLIHDIGIILTGVISILILIKFKRPTPVTIGLSWFSIALGIHNLVTVGVKVLGFGDVKSVLLLHAVLGTISCGLVLRLVIFSFIGEIFKLELRTKVAFLCTLGYTATKLAIIKFYEITQNETQILITLLSVFGFTFILGLVIRYWRPCIKKENHQRGFGIVNKNDHILTN